VALPMMSVFKLPLALEMLREIDAGRHRLDEPVPLTAGELRPGVSPLAEAWHRGAKAPSLETMLGALLLESDNTAGDKLVTMLGGGAAITDRLHGLRLDGIVIAEQEIAISARINCPGAAAPSYGWTPKSIATCHAPRRAVAAALQHEIVAAPNAASTDALVALLVAIDRGDLLSSTGQRWLVDALAATQVKPERLRAGLPPATRLAHRTGTGETRDGVNLATNDIGLVSLPDGSRLAIAVLTAGRRGSEAALDATIAAVARAAYAVFTAPASPPDAR
jgi:beta-lactamase class A